MLGAFSGLLVGALALGALLAQYVVPGEVCTLQRMRALQSGIEGYHHHHAGYPVPVEGNGIDIGLVSDTKGGWPFCLTSSTGTQAPDHVSVDAFGRRLQYDVSGRWPYASYRLRSLGYDGHPGSDDLCLDGRSRAREAVNRLADAASAIHYLLGDSAERASREHWWSALRASA